MEKKKANPIKKILESRLFSQIMPVGLLIAIQVRIRRSRTILKFYIQPAWVR